MNIAVIDLGTNTFNLLIARVNDVNFDILHSAKQGVSIGMGGINNKCIAPEALERGVKCLIEFKQLCDEFSVQKINAYGTSAIRDAENSKDFIDSVFKATGIEITVIDGDLEAQLIYNGVRWSYDFSEKAVIMDVGGGSTEFIFADQGGILDMRSMDIGLLRIFHGFQFSDPMTTAEIEQIKAWLDEKSGRYFDGKKEKILIGASGTFETFFEMIFEQFLEHQIALIELPFAEFTATLDEIIRSTEAERDLDERIIPIRKHMAPIAAVKVQWVVEKLGIEQVFLSTCSLKEGALKF